MSKLWTGLITVVVLLIAALVQPACVFACSCLPPGPPQQALADATAVFAGTVTAMNAPAEIGGPEPVQVTFTVSESWKGADQPTVVVSTPSSSASCGVGFEQGNDYLVYATAGERGLEANLCSRTTQLSAAAEDLAALGQGTAPAQDHDGAATPAVLPATGRDAASQYLLRAMLASAALAAIVLGAVIVRRAKSGN